MLFQILLVTLHQKIGPKSWLITSEKVLFELSSFSKFSQNSLIDSKINADNAYIGSIYLPLSGYLYSFSVWVCFISTIYGDARSLLKGICKVQSHTFSISNS